MSSANVSPVEPAADLTRYHTFWARFIAGLFDGMVLVPVAWTTTLLVGYGRPEVAIAWVVAAAPVGWLYTSYCHGRWGQTIGKRAAKIRVVRADTEGPIGYRRALRRDIGNILFSTMGSILLVVWIQQGETDAFRVFSAVSTDLSSAEGPLGPSRDAFSGYEPANFILLFVNSAWALTEVGTMLLNQKRRALHDFIGGTVVVNLDRPKA